MSRRTRANGSSRNAGRETQHLVLKLQHFSASRLSGSFDVAQDGRIAFHVNHIVRDPSAHAGDLREGFSRSEVAKIRSLAETGGREPVRRAAQALLAFATGKTLKEAVATTPYGMGWLCGIRECYRTEGLDGLRRREYRAPRK